jgi:hypothetical protein
MPNTASVSVPGIFSTSIKGGGRQLLFSPGFAQRPRARMNTGQSLVISATRYALYISFLSNLNF